MNCSKRGKPIPMIQVKLNFMGYNVSVVYYCLLCYNFVSKVNPEIDVLRQILLSNVENEGILPKIK